MDAANIPSISQLARDAGVSVETARRIVYGTRANPSEETMRRIASALRIPASLAGEWVGLTLHDRQAPYEPPREASLLSQRQREAVDEVIRLFAAGNRERTDSEGLGYVDETEAKLRRVQQSDYAPAAHPDIRDPFEGLGEESQESE